MGLLQLDPPIPLETNKGTGYAILVIDYSQEHSLLWVVMMDESREIWCVPNEEVKGQVNWSMNRRKAAKKATKPRPKRRKKA